MQQPLHTKLFRIHNPSRQGALRMQKAVHLAVHKPVLDQYNKISLDKTSNYVRIKHKSTSIPRQPQTTNATHHAAPSNKEWENTVEQYIESKKIIQLRRGEPDITFGFHPLDRTNMFRYKKLASQEALPVDIVSIAQKNDKKNANNPERRLLRNSFEIGRLSRSKISTRRIAQIPRDEKELLSLSMPEAQLERTGSTALQERVIHHFIEKYFRGKYRRNQRQLKQLKSRSYAGYNFPRRNTD